METPDTAPLRARFTPGIVIACAALSVTIAMGARQSFGLFLNPISMDLDIGRQTFGLAVAIQNLSSGWGNPYSAPLPMKAGRRGSSCSGPSRMEWA